MAGSVNNRLRSFESDDEWQVSQDLASDRQHLSISHLWHKQSSSNRAPRILAIASDAALRRLVQLALERDGYAVV
jgi:hypothetical protein